MGKVEPADLVHALQWRYATKKFDPTRKVPEATWKAIEQAAIFAPSSYGLQPWKFVVVTDQAMKQKASEAAYNQPQPRDCSHLVVFASRKGVGAGDVEKYMARIAQVRGVPRDSLNGFADAINGTIKSLGGGLGGSLGGALGAEGGGGAADVWCSRQTYIALGFLVLACASLGVDACPMEGLDRGAYDKLFGLDRLGYQSLAMAAVGYRAPGDEAAGKAKVRFEAKDVVLRF